MARKFDHIVGICVAFAAISLLCGCAVRYSTILGSSAGLASGSPVYIRNAKVGTVTGVHPIPSGGVHVGFKVDRANAAQVHVDSVALLHADSTPPSLEVLTPRGSSDIAPAWMTIAGAVNPVEANMIIRGTQAGNGPAGLANALTALGVGLMALSQPWQISQFNQELQDAQHEALGAGHNGQAVARQRLPKLERDLAEFQKDLVAQGKQAQANQLGAQLDTFARTWGISRTSVFSPSP